MLKEVVRCTKSAVPSLKFEAATVIRVFRRPKEVESKRMDLPIVMMEQEIMEAINENISVIICGETGCGKTTQVPQVRAYVVRLSCFSIESSVCI